MNIKSIQQFVFFSLLIGTTLSIIFILGKFLVPLFWAVVFAMIFYPLYLYFNKKFKGRENLASLSTIVSIILIVLIPLVVIGKAVAEESIDFYKYVSESKDLGNNFGIFDWINTVIARFEFLGFSEESISSNIYSGISNVSQYFYSFFISFGQSIFSFFIYLMIMLYLMFFLLRDGLAVRDKLKKYLPLNKGGEEKILSRFADTTRAVVVGTFVIALIQGIIGGIVFLIAGVSSPALWGVVMFAVSIIPAFGPFLIWGPVGFILLLSGLVWQGVFVLLSGLFIISLVDNILRPVLVGRSAKMPDPVVLLSTIGGITYLGISGFIIGPIVAALALALWEMFGEEYGYKKG